MSLLTFQALVEEEEIKEKYDLVIVGAGPAGCSAAIYARRFQLETLIVAKELGGLIVDAEIVDNYPGLPEIPGSELGNKFLEHAKKYMTNIIMEEVESIEKKESGFLVRTMDGKTVEARAIILATGEKHRKLNVPGEEEFLGRGVSYCGLCDAPLFKDRVVAVVGGGNVAFSDAQLLAKHAKKVILIHRRNWFRADPIEVKRVKENSKIEILTPYIVREIKGDMKVEKLLLEKTKEVGGEVIPTGELKEIEVDGIFVDIGLVPNSELAKKSGVAVDERGYIIVDDFMRTNVEGIFAAGDVTDKGSKFRQVVLAAAQGAIAAISVYNYLKSKE